MKSWDEREQMVTDAVRRIRRECSLLPSVGVILGSGFAPLVREIELGCAIPYETIPHFRVPSVHGHHGFLILGRLGGATVAFLQGRVHLYEGHPIEDVVFPVRVLAGLGIHSLIVTNASGSLTEKIGPGEVMLVTDQIDLMFRPPLRGQCGWKSEPIVRRAWAIYDRNYMEVAREAARRTGIVLHQGTLCTTKGPSYETAAESRFMHKIGGDAACMSTSHEVAVARTLGLKVLGLSCISNLATGIGTGELSHDEVTRLVGETVKRIVPFLRELIREIAR
ncbi:MAG: purine-nucleoside phosphorylase [Candidatus Eisenbacteria bacterium]|nr:purine-nucleoside phosphorylase [Candidatus Eisenbacteria bacterium]